MSDQNENPRTPANGTAGTTPADNEPGKGSGTGQPPNGEQPTEDWKAKHDDLSKRYEHSSAEGIRLSKEIQTFKESEIAGRARLATLEKELQELQEVAKGSNPQGYDAVQMRRKYDDISSQLAAMKEGQELDRFVASDPTAAKHRDALRDLGRAFPGRSYGDLWSTHFAAVIEAEKVLAEGKKARGEAAPDSGKGTSTGEPSGEGKIGGYSQDAFNKLPLAKRREVLLKNGINEVVPA